MNFRIKHSAVGPFVENEVVTAEDLKSIDTDRLVRLDAIEQTDADPFRLGAPVEPAVVQPVKAETKVVKPLAKS